MSKKPNDPSLLQNINLGAAKAAIFAGDVVGFVPGVGKPVELALKAGGHAVHAQTTAEIAGEGMIAAKAAAVKGAVHGAVDSIPGVTALKMVGVISDDGPGTGQTRAAKTPVDPAAKDHIKRG